MSYNTTAIYGMPYQSRCIAAQHGDPEHHRFLVATSQLRSANEIHLIDFHEDDNEIDCVAVYKHENETWALAPSRHDARTFFTVHNNQEDKLRGTLWRAPELAEGDEVSARRTDTGSREAAEPVPAAYSRTSTSQIPRPMIDATPPLPSCIRPASPPLPPSGYPGCRRPRSEPPPMRPAFGSRRPRPASWRSCARCRRGAGACSTSRSGAFRRARSTS